MRGRETSKKEKARPAKIAIMIGLRAIAFSVVTSAPRAARPPVSRASALPMTTSRVATGIRIGVWAAMILLIATSPVSPNAV